jgi:hypothetical protein
MALTPFRVDDFAEIIELQAPGAIQKTVEQFAPAVDTSMIIAAKPGFTVSPAGRGLKVFCNHRFMDRRIYTFSFSLYINLLSQCRMNLLFKAEQNTVFTHRPIKIKPVAFDRLKIANILIEKLAFRHRYQLQSHKLTGSRPVFNCSFKRGNKLKSVLETFGNTISSMVQKYDIITASPSGNGEGAK